MLKEPCDPPAVPLHKPSVPFRAGPTMESPSRRATSSWPRSCLSIPGSQPTPLGQDSAGVPDLSPTLATLSLPGRGQLLCGLRMAVPSRSLQVEGRVLRFPGRPLLLVCSGTPRLQAPPFPEPVSLLFKKKYVFTIKLLINF